MYCYNTYHSRIAKASTPKHKNDKGRKKMGGILEHQEEKTEQNG